MTHRLVLTLSCPDRRGIAHAVTGVIAGVGGNITDSAQFHDPGYGPGCGPGDASGGAGGAGRFFLRTAFEGAADRDAFEAAFAGVASEFGMAAEVHDAGHRPRTLVLVSRFGHCLNDLLHRHATGQLAMDLVGVASNHEDWRARTEAEGVPFHHLPVAKGEKAAQEARLDALCEAAGAELIVLARYMQVLSDGFCRGRAGRIINIHHSFLPGFKGARPYHRAHARGVKLIGATAHYVTPDLDEGPIIEQGTLRVSHAMSPEQLVAAGRDVECQVLARAVALHLDHRVLMNGERTVVFG